MFVHLYLTDDCNLSCSYCRGKIFDTPELDRENISIDEDIPADVTYNLQDLYRFLSGDPDPVVTFIGGEPTLRSGLLIRIMEEAPARRFMIQTNGTGLHRLPTEIVNRFETILISLDGDRMTTDQMRGEGTYNRVTQNIQHIIANGYQGELIARITVHEPADIRKSVTHLTWNPEYPFTSVHWQMDADFWNDYSLRSFKRWSQESYIPGIRQLIRDWVDHMEQTGEVLRWYPFIDPVQDLLSGKKTRLRCGSGYANYTILTDGSIAPCPIMVGMTDYYSGNIRSATFADLRDFPVKGRCEQCDIQDFCGGRCLYSSIMEPWPAEGRNLVCDTVRDLREGLIAVLPRIKEMLQEEKISLEQFVHEKYNGCEIIP